VWWRATWKQAVTRVVLALPAELVARWRVHQVELATQGVAFVITLPRTSQWHLAECMAMAVHGEGMFVGLDA
jgi:hypothetical protein